MNAFVCKPFRLDDLVATILQVTTTPSTSVRSTDFDDDEALNRFAGNRDIYVHALAAFTQDVQKLLNDLPKLFPDPTDEKLNRTLHTLKGLAATVGANALVTVAKEIYQKLKDGSLSHKQWPKYHRALKAKGLDAIASAQRILKESAPESKESPLLSHKLHLFKKLIPYLETNNLKALELYAELKQRVGTDKALDAAMERLDFKTAVIRCQLLIKQPIEGNS